VVRIRHLTIVLGDQLDHSSAAFDDFDNSRDMVWMAEVREESTHVPSHKARTALFLSAMRHFAEELRERSRRVEYRKLNAKTNEGSFDAELRKAIKRFRPEAIVVVEPGEYRVEQILKQVSGALDVRLEIRADRHFFCSRAEFASWAKAHDQLRMEFFYRNMRKRSGILMERGKPEGEQWNFDGENRKSFGSPVRECCSPRRILSRRTRSPRKCSKWSRKHFPKTQDLSSTSISL
jgi:deoxyribodipyrimidine photolyase-related protein